MELRCEYKLHGIISAGKLEVRCDSRLCGKIPGVVVLHTIDLETGKVETTRYQEPPGSKVKERRSSGAISDDLALRAP